MDAIPHRSEWFAIDNGLPQPIWSKVFSWLRAEVEHKDQEAFWHQFVRDWLQRLSSALGPAYVADESANFHMLSADTQSARADTIQFVESTRRRILTVLGDRARPRGTIGKHLVLRFANDADYYRHVSHYHSEGERGMTSGIFIPHGYMHIATYNHVPAGQLRPTLVHELAHNLTAHLPLPLWLNESLAMYFEGTIGGGELAPSAVNLMEDHRSFWTSETIQQFWKGDSFSSVAGQRVSYSLAATLFRLIRTDIRPQPETLQRFVLASDWGDAGEAAAIDYLGIHLKDLAATFLGPGDWNPKPETWQPAKPEEEAAVEGMPDENGFVWPEGLEPEPDSR